MADNLRPLSDEDARARSQIVFRHRPRPSVRIPELGMFTHILAYEDLLPDNDDEEEPT